MKFLLFIFSSSPVVFRNLASDWGEGGGCKYVLGLVYLHLACNPVDRIF